MYDFFTNRPGLKFETFSVLHIFIIIGTLLSCMLVIIYKEKLKKSPIAQLMPKILATILFLNMSIFYVSYLITGSYDIKVNLPLHYCYVTGYIFMYMLWFDKKKLYNFLYYSVFMCTVAVLIWADPVLSYDRIVFYQFFISHAGLLIINFYVFYVMDYPVNKKGITQAIIYSNTLFSIMAVYNKRFDTNYILSEKFPDFLIELYPFLNYVKYPIIILEVFGIISILLAYLFVYHKNKNKL